MRTFYLWLWHTVPANPLVVRTVQGASRRARHQWVRIIYLTALMGLLIFSLLAKGGLNPGSSLTELAKAGTAIFAFVSYAQVALICLIAPLFLAGAIAQEQAGKTYEILLATPLTNLQIVLGSLLGRLFFVLALLASGLPLFAVLLIFGGVPVSSVFVAFAVAALVALVVGSVAVTLSVLRAGGRKAVFVFIVAIAGYLVAAYVLDFALLRNTATKTTTWLTPLHPLLVLESFLNTNYQPPPSQAFAARAWPVRFYMTQPLGAFATLSAVTSFVLVIWSTIFARSIVQSVGTANWIRRWLRLSGGGGERRHPPRPVRGNPIAWREAHTRANQAGSILARWGFLTMALIAVLAALIAYHLGTLSANGFRDTVTTLLLVELAVIVMVGIYMSAGAVSAEREDGTLDLILTTPVTPRQYIWGKLRGLVRFLTLLLAAPVLTVAVVSAYTLVASLYQWPQAMVTDAVVGGTVRHMLMLPEAPVLLTAILVPFVALCVMVGMNWSLKSKGVIGAVVPTVAIVGAVALVMGFCGLQMSRNVVVLGPIVNCFSPATSIIMLVNPWVGVSGFADEPIAGRLSLLFGAAVAAAGYSFVVYAVLSGMVRNFDQTVRKLTGTG